MVLVVSFANIGHRYQIVCSMAPLQSKWTGFSTTTLRRYPGSTYMVFDTYANLTSVSYPRWYYNV